MRTYNLFPVLFYSFCSTDYYGRDGLYILLLLPILTDLIHCTSISMDNFITKTTANEHIREGKQVTDIY